MKQITFDFYNDYGIANTFHPRDYRHGKVRYGLTFTFLA